MVSCHAEVEKTGMIGALPVLVPGCREVCPSSVWYLGDIRRGSAVHFFSHPSNFFYFIFFFLSFYQPHPSNLSRFVKDLFTFWSVAAELQAALLAQAGRQAGR